MAKNLIFWHKLLIKKILRFFFKNRASSLFYTWNRLTCCKKSEKSNDRKYENFCHGRTDWLTDWLTDGTGFIRTCLEDDAKKSNFGWNSMNLKELEGLWKKNSEDRRQLWKIEIPGKNPEVWNLHTYIYNQKNNCIRYCSC